MSGRGGGEKAAWFLRVSCQLLHPRHLASSWSSKSWGSPSFAWNYVLLLLHKNILISSARKQHYMHGSFWGGGKGMFSRTALQAGGPVMQGWWVRTDALPQCSWGQSYRCWEAACQLWRQQKFQAACAPSVSRSLTLCMDVLGLNGPNPKVWHGKTPVTYRCAPSRDWVGETWPHFCVSNTNTSSDWSVGLFLY